MNLSDFAVDDNQVLREIISNRIRAEDSISFAEFYDLAMYHPVHGYYICCDPTQDYQSSPNVHPVFGTLIARQISDFWHLMDRPYPFDVFEAGAGNGRLAADILRALQKQTPDLYDSMRYVVQDVGLAGADATTKLERAGVSLDKVTLRPDLPNETSLDGCVLSNELLDALPFERVRVRDGRLLQVRVGLMGGEFVDVEAPATSEIEDYFARLGLRPGEGCEAEVGLRAAEWTRKAATGLRRGYMLTLDYGYDSQSLYAPWRKQGTMLTFYRHTSSDDPYRHIGRQDITASVDFTSVARAGEATGLTTLGRVTQTDFLVSLGIGEALQQSPAAGELETYFSLRRSVIELTNSAGLGRISVLIQGKDVPDELPQGLASQAKIDRPDKL